MRRLVCVVEGKGEVQAVPNLCARILHALGAVDWYVDKEPIRRPRSQLIDESVPSPRRPCRMDGIKKALAIASARKPDAILILCDADDDCPGSWSSSINERMERGIPRAAVMAVREFEGWLLWNFSERDRAEVKASDPERIRNAKGRLEKLIPGYAPTTHQLALTRQIDVEQVRALSRSFDKLVRAVGSICNIEVHPRRHG